MNSDYLKLITDTLIGAAVPLAICFTLGFNWLSVTLLILGTLLGFVVGLLGRKQDY